MSNAISTHRPVLQHRQPATLLAIAGMAVAGLGGTAAVLVTSGGDDFVGHSAGPVSAMAPNGDIRYDGGPEEGTRGPLPLNTSSSAPAGVRYDGGPEEGTRSIAIGR